MKGVVTLILHFFINDSAKFREKYRQTIVSRFSMK